MLLSWNLQAEGSGEELFPWQPRHCGNPLFRDPISQLDWNNYHPDSWKLPFSLFNWELYHHGSVAFLLSQIATGFQHYSHPSASEDLRVTGNSLRVLQKVTVLPFTTAAGRDSKVNSAQSRTETAPQSHFVLLTLWEKAALPMPVRNWAQDLQTYLPLGPQPLPPPPPPPLC